MIEQIQENFENGIKNVFLASNESLCEHLPHFEKSFDRVIYAVCDRESHILCEMFSIDTLLKRSLMTASSVNCLNDLEDLLVKNTLLVVDNYNIPSPSPYMRHLMSCKCNLLVAGKRRFNVSDNNSVSLENGDYCDEDAFCDLSGMSDGQRELFVTIAAFLKYLPKGEMFTSSSLCEYVGGICENLDALLNMGLVVRNCDDTLSVGVKVSENFLKEHIGECKSFLQYSKRCNGFSRELYFISTAFAGLLKKDFVYNLLVGASNESKDIFSLINREYYLSVLFEACDFQNPDEVFKLVKLIVKLIGCLPDDFYAYNEPVLKILLKIMQRFYEEVSKIPDDRFRLRALLDAIENLCPLFCMFEAVDKYGNYNPKRDRLTKCTLNLVSDAGCAEKYGIGLDASSCVVTMRLYAEFQKYLDEYLLLYKRTKLSKQDIYAQNFGSKAKEYADLSKRISRHFARIDKTYNCFFDLFSPEYEKIKLISKSFDKAFEEKLKSNRRYVLRGFDGGTKTGAERYAKSVVETVMKAKNPIPYIRLVRSCDYPIGNECYKSLVKLGFGEILCNNKAVSDREKMYFLCELVDNYDEHFEKQALSELYEIFIDSLLESLTFPETVGKALFDCGCRMYVSGAIKELVSEKPIENSYSKRLFQRLVPFGKNTHDNSDAVIAMALYSKNENRHIEYSDQRLKNALVCYVKESLSSGEEVNFDGIMQLCRLLIGKKDADEVKQVLLDLCGRK